MLAGALFLKFPVEHVVAGQDFLGYHVAADGTEIIMIIGDDKIDFPLCVVPAFFESFRDLFKDNQFFL